MKTKVSLDRALELTGSEQLDIAAQLEYLAHMPNPKRQPMPDERQINVFPSKVGYPNERNPQFQYPSWTYQIIDSYSGHRHSFMLTREQIFVMAHNKRYEDQKKQ